MERLNLQAIPDRPNIEATIHFARYAVGKNLVQHKRVLDVACGEGYGTFLLRKNGASSVVGVDISAESIDRAKRSFGGDGVEYIASDVKDLENLFAGQCFDVVISVETVEHVENAPEFLRTLKRLVKPNGVIILSCPNDHWYYPEAERANPYHRRKYHLNEFQDLAVSALGSNVQWSVGTGVLGFASTPLHAGETYEKVPGTWMSFKDVAGAYLVSGETEIEATATQCSYFVGVWNAPVHPLGLAVYPLSMDEYAVLVRGQEAFENFRSECASLERAAQLASAEAAGAHADAQAIHRALSRLDLGDGKRNDKEPDTFQLVQELDKTLEAYKRNERHLGLKSLAAQAEAQFVIQALRVRLAESESAMQVFRVKTENAMKALQTKSELELHSLHEECNRYRIGYERYIRLRKVIPPMVRSWAVRFVKGIRSRGKK